jgi:4-hydroxybenzoate polyprenyltransferase
MKELWHFYLYSSLFLATAAVGMAFISCLLQGLDFSLTIAAVLSLVVFSVYNQNRKTDMTEDSLNHGERFHVTSGYAKFLYGAAIAAYGIAFVLSALHGLLALATCSIPLVCGLFYSLPILPRNCGYRRLKEIPVGKNLVVSFSWALSFSLLPVMLSGTVPGIHTLVVFFFIFSWTIIASVLPDIRDCTGDAAAGIRTIPVIIGARRTELFLTAFNILSGLSILHLGRGVLSGPGLWTIGISLAYSQGCILLINRGWNNNFTCDVISDGQFITIALAGIVLLFGVHPFSHFPFS